VIQAVARWGRFFLVLSFMLIAGIALGLIAWAKREGVLAVHRALVETEAWFLAWRLMLFGALMAFWQEIMRWLSGRLELSSRAQAQLVGWRWRAGTGLLLMDLILVEDLLGLLESVF